MDVSLLLNVLLYECSQWRDNNTYFSTFLWTSHFKISERVEFSLYFAKPWYRLMEHPKICMYSDRFIWKLQLDCARNEKKKVNSTATEVKMKRFWIHLLQQILVKVVIVLLCQRPYNPDLGPCDFKFFFKLKSLWREKGFEKVQKIN